MSLSLKDRTVTYQQFYLFNMSVKGHRHVQQDLALLHTPNKILYPVFELMGSLIDFLWITLSRLSKLLGCF